MKEAEFKMGENPNPTPTTKEEIASDSGVELRDALHQFLEDEKLARGADENAASYTLRVWRYIQRYYTDWAYWGGWPIPEEMMLPHSFPTELWASRIDEKHLEGIEVLSHNRLGDLTEKSLSCPAVAFFGETSKSANIPYQIGQGYWLEKTAGKSSTGHMRVLLFLEKSGWILMDDEKKVTSKYGQFTQGHKTGDNYIIYVAEKVAFSHDSNLDVSPFTEWETKEINPAGK